MTITPAKHLMSLAVTMLALVHPARGDGATYSFQEGDLRNVTTDTLIDSNYITEATYLFERSNNSNYDATGEIKLGQDWSAGNADFTGLFEFDLSTIMDTAPGKLITTRSVKLNIYLFGADGGGNSTHTLYRYDYDLVESGATWNNPDGDGRDSAGGTAGAPLNSTIGPYKAGNELDTYKTFASSPAFVTAVGDALAGADRTLRLIVPGQAWDTGFYRDDEYAAVEQRPELVVEFVSEDPPELAIVTYSPTNGATKVDVRGDLIAEFNLDVETQNRRIDTNTVGAVTLTNLTHNTAIVIPVGDPRLSIIDGCKLKIDPTANLDADSEYAVLISTNAVRDNLGNFFAGIADTNTWRFATEPADTAAPTVLALSPTNDATAVPPGMNLTATFSEEIALSASGNITIANLTDKTETTIPSGDSQLSVTTSNLTIDVAPDLLPGKRYAVLIDSNAVKDVSAAGNFFAGIADVSTWSFTTAPRASYGITNILSFQEGDLRDLVMDRQIDVNYTTEATYLYEGAVNDNYDATGTIKLGRQHSADKLYTGLFEFDLSEIPEPGPGGVLDVKSATLNIYIFATSGGGSKTHALHAYDYDLVESAATWNNPAGNGSDTTLGGRAGANLNSSVSYTGGGGAPTYKTFASSPAFAAAVSDALAREDRTLRLIVPGAIWDNGHFRDDEYEVVEQRPELIVTYTSIPPSGAVFVVR